MHDRVKVIEFFSIVENDRSYVFAVQTALYIRFFAKDRADAAFYFFIFVHDAFGFHIGIVNRYAQLFEYPGYHTFAGTDTACQAYFQHPCIFTCAAPERCRFKCKQQSRDVDPLFHISSFQREAYSGTHIGCAANVDGLTMRFNDVFADCKA